MLREGGTHIDITIIIIIDNYHGFLLVWHLAIGRQRVNEHLV